MVKRVTVADPIRFVDVEAVKVIDVPICLGGNHGDLPECLQVPPQIKNGDPCKHRHLLPSRDMPWSPHMVHLTAVATFQLSLWVVQARHCL
jgi:hypothetical protein